MYDDAPLSLPDPTDGKRKNSSNSRYTDGEFCEVERDWQARNPGLTLAAHHRVTMLAVARGRLVPATAAPSTPSEPPPLHFVEQVMEFLGVFLSEKSLSEVRADIAAYRARLQAEADEKGGGS